MMGICTRRLNCVKNRCGVGVRDGRCGGDVLTDDDHRDLRIMREFA